MSDVFRKTYRTLNPDEVAALDAIKSKAQELYTLLEGTLFPEQAHGSLNVAREFNVKADARSMALAKTKLEESVFWAVKGITG